MKLNADVTAYIAAQPSAQRKALKQLRSIIGKVVPKAEEVISYKMPAYKMNGMLVWFAGCTHHVALYPKAKAIAVFKHKLKDFGTSKGTVKFPLNKTLPVKLIQQIVRFNVRENLGKI
jgi:uncharacterized protein YdhG (YjbR/CyaY superfamily)